MKDKQISIFPLGIVVFPGSIQSLQIFEPRYLNMVKRCMAEDEGFVITLLQNNLDNDEIASDWKTSSLTKEQIVLCNFAEKLTLKPGEITQFDYKELQKNNFDDKAISEIVQVISYFNYINRVADGLGLEPEEFIDEKGYKK